MIRRRGVPCLPSEGHITVNKTSLKTLQKEGGWGVSYCLRSSCEKVKNQVKFGTNNIQHIIQWTHWGFSCHFCPLHYAHHMTTLFSNGNDTPLSTMCTQHTTSCLWQPNWCLLCICGWQYLLHLDYDPSCFLEHVPALSHSFNASMVGSAFMWVTEEGTDVLWA